MLQLYFESFEHLYRNILYVLCILVSQSRWKTLVKRIGMEMSWLNNYMQGSISKTDMAII